jgi:UMF1 family MFS transporter
MKRKISYWALYDFANSIVFVVFVFFFSQWLVIEQGQPAWWYNAALSISALLFTLAAPFVSLQIDRSGQKIAGLRLWTALSFVGFLTVSWIALSSDRMDALAAVLFTLTLTAFLLCLLYHVPMLNDLSTRENRSKISGLGQGANSLGQVAGLLLALPFVSGAVVLFGGSGREETLLPATLLFGLLSLPLLFLYRETLLPVGDEAVSRNAFSLLRVIFSHKPVVLFLAANFFFTNALLTFANNFPLFLEEVHGVADTTKALLTVAILTIAFIGAIVFGIIGDRKGIKRTLLFALATWVILLPAIAFAPNFQVLIPILLVAGILYGPVLGLSRALMGQLALPSLTASSFSYHTLTERFAAFAGPAVWSGALVAFGGGAQGYQAAFLAMVVFLLIGMVFLWKVPYATSPRPDSL